MNCDPTFPGVMYAESLRANCFTGTADALVSAGLLRADQLPGAAGNGRTMVTFLPGGLRVQKGRCSTKGLAGCVSVRQRGKHLLEMQISVSREVWVERVKEWDRQREEEQALKRVWPFPICHGRPA